MFINAKKSESKAKGTLQKREWVDSIKSTVLEVPRLQAFIGVYGYGASVLENWLMCH
jgi:hypothetical protein